MTTGTRSTSLRIAVDIGGTFTDGIAHASPGGRIWVAKRLTTPDDPGRAVSQVVADLLALVPQPRRTAQAAAATVSEVVHGTTLVTNTISERDGARTGLLVTRGPRDVLDIGRENRYDPYDLDIEFPEPPSLFDDYEGRVAAASHKMGIDGHMRMASDLMLFSTEKDMGVIKRLTPEQRKAYVAAFDKENAAFLANPQYGHSAFCAV